MNRGRYAGLSVACVMILFGAMLGLNVPRASADHLGWGFPVAVATDLVGNATVPQVAVDSMGHAIVVWTQLEGPEWNPARSVWANRYAPGLGWDTPVRISVVGFSAHGPSIAFDADGNAISVWSQEDQDRQDAIWSNRYVSDVGWESPTRVSEVVDSAGGAIVATSDDGTAITTWTQGSGGIWGRRPWANRFVPGEGWGAPVSIGEDVVGGCIWDPESSCPLYVDYTAGIAMDRRGNALAIWHQEGRGWHPLWAARYVANTGWDTPTLLAVGGHVFDLAMDPLGNAMVVWENRTREWDEPCCEWSFNIMAMQYVIGLGWQAAKLVAGADDDALLSYPQVAMDSGGNALAVWYRGDTWYGQKESVYASRFIPGAGWETPTAISTMVGGAFPPNVAVSVGGGAVATWIQTGDSGANIWASRFEPDLGWWRALPVGSAMGWDEREYAPAPGVVLDRLGNAVITWSQDRSDEWGIWANTYTAPLPGLEGELQDTRDDLDAAQELLGQTRDELQGTNEELTGTQNALDGALAALASSEARIILFIGLQGALVVLVGVLSVMLWRSRTGIPVLRGKGPAFHRSKAAATSRELEESWRRWSAAIGPLRLSSKERVLVHLLDYAKYTDRGEVPPEMTQVGIAQAAGVDLRHFSQYIRPLAGEGLVTERTARVAGALQRRRAYALTEKGTRTALGIVDRIRSASVTVRDTSGVREASMADVLEELRGSRTLLDVVQESLRNGFVNLMT